MAEESLLVKCCSCRSVEIFDYNKNKNIWLNRDRDPIIYNFLEKEYIQNFTGSFCPQCYEKEMKKINEPDINKSDKKYTVEMTKEINFWPLEMPREFFG